MSEYYQGDPQQLMDGAVKIRGLHDQLVGLRSQFQNAHNRLTEDIQTPHVGAVRQQYGDNVLGQWNQLHGSLQQIYETLQSSGVNMAEVDQSGAAMIVNQPGGGLVGGPGGGPVGGPIDGPGGGRINLSGI
ncbi:hypothetical protein ABIA39_005152 [Nocardia sp. GAS34]|uniref:WXG100 family type VII secretion target n=1 Tax=unclassified Nocardia TaxID=2637762 RepID=UPI003D25F571